LRFSKLRLTGFKSFVDPTELVIEEGLTGVVGPNGCGKSNLVEALRWVMGESNARQMRGGGMDDVIFGGTDKRPSRNMAEVALTVDNSDRRAPSQFNDSVDLEIVRRIERDKGSHYKVNGRETRARDVQLLFADAATGSRSAGLVSQGKIGSIISAKPTDRRALLEEAANIRGLHSRRHEAELRLKAAEQNLEKLEEVLKALESQRQGLRRQAKQAQRYRGLSEQIRRAESIVLHRRWLDIKSERGGAGEALAKANDRVVEATRLASEAATVQSEAALALPDLRKNEAAAAAELQRMTATRSELEAEARRIATAKSEAETRLRQINDDIVRESTLLEEATAALERLAGEREALVRAGDGEAETQAESQARLTAANRAAEDAETAVHAATEAIAIADAKRASLERQARQATERLERLERQQAEMAARRTELAEQAVPETERTSAGLALTEAEETLAAAEAALPAAREAREAAKHAEQAAREALRAIDGELSGLRAEADGLRRLLVETDEGGAPIVDALVVEPGFETALGAALGDDLEAPLLAEAALQDVSHQNGSHQDGSHQDKLATGWRDGEPGAPAPAASWPDGVTPLSAHVTAPRALARRLSLIGLASDAATARAAQKTLQSGARIVTKDGGLWRWDGFSVAPGAPSAAVIRLERRNRLAELEEAIGVADRRRNDAVETGTRAERALAETEASVETARAAVSDASEAVSRTRSAKAEIESRIAAVETKLAALDDGAARLATEREEAAQQKSSAETGLAEIPDIDALRRQSQSLRAEMAERRTELVEIRSAHDQLIREAEQRRSRLSGVEGEIRSWSERKDRAGTRLGELDERKTSEDAEIGRLDARPAQIAEQQAKLTGLVEAAEIKRQEAADILVKAESRQGELDRLAREGERAASEAREDKVRAESALERINQDLRTTRERIAERLECEPDEILEKAGIDPNEPLADTEQVQSKLDRLIGEREGMGPVNLRAEAELEELDLQIEGMENERDDLTAAIAKLRSGIAALNREGRERLLEAFHKVERHFKTLFQTLFGGGEAHLRLTDADDPLEAGLEIMASPPGKKLQVMSLLSGGEQALTAIALVFAVFLTNPAPICVLDEVDAPLDDTNVNRFCRLLEMITKETGTRFLVITHHRMTMTRMDRLFGVTMAERGVSHLVSVDMSRAERLRESA
jgi:chromosome segregation protein